MPDEHFSGLNDRILIEFLTKVPDFSNQSVHPLIIENQALHTISIYSEASATQNIIDWHAER